ncbi:MAG: TIGR03915 family putative DNA repair protein [Odoribacter sp.]
MIIFTYDKTFEGLLTCIFEAYYRKLFPDILLPEQSPLPLFYDSLTRIFTDGIHSSRVWKGLEKKLSPAGLSVITNCWLSEFPESDILLFRYIRKALDAPFSIELNFGDPDVLQATQISKKVNNERHRIIQFTRFQKAIDGTYFAAMEPLYNALPLTLPYFKDRFADQKWIIYDIKRAYGYYYDLHEVTEICFTNQEQHLTTGKLDSSLMAKDEPLFQQLWKTYFKSIGIKERINPKLHRQHLPVRFWKYLTEKNK